MAAQLSFYLKPVLSVRVNFKLGLGSTLFIRELTLYFVGIRNHVPGLFRNQSSICSNVDLTECFKCLHKFGVSSYEVFSSAHVPRILRLHNLRFCDVSLHFAFFVYFVFKLSI